MQALLKWIREASLARLISLIVVVVLVGILTFQTTPQPVIFKNDITQTGTLLAYLFVVALFLERSLEVFITAWREPSKLKQEREIKRLTEAVLANTMTQAELDAAKGELEVFRSNTRSLALLVSFAFGLIISAVGVRTLQQFVEVDGLKALSETQLNLFHLADVCLTGGLLAGGSEGIHKVTQVYTNYMDASAERAKRAQG